MRAENAGSAPERAGRGGLRGTVSASAAVSDACGALRLTEKRVPMKLLFKQRFFSWFDSYDIYDDNGATVFTVEGKLAWGHCLHILNAAGEHIGTVQQRVLTFLPKFDLYEFDRCIGTIKKEFTFFVPHFTVEGSDWAVEGQFMEWDYTIVSASRGTVATIGKELFHWTDTYVIDVADPADALHALMVVLAIDAEKCSRSN